MGNPMFLHNTHSGSTRFPLAAQSHGHVIFDVGEVGTVGRPVSLKVEPARS